MRWLGLASHHEVAEVVTLEYTDIGRELRRFHVLVTGALSLGKAQIWRCKGPFVVHGVSDPRAALTKIAEVASLRGPWGPSPG